MAGSIHDKHFPGENEEYRIARNNLLKAEMELRENIERVAKLRRELPAGGKIKEDYLFEELVNGVIKETKLSELFEEGKDSLIIYSYMFGQKIENPCPACTSLIDGFNGISKHIIQRVNFVVVAKSPIERVIKFSDERGWYHVHILSSEKNNYNADYFAQTLEGNQIPACNVFVKRPEGIFHFYSTELLYAPSEGHPRHMDLMWPIWNFFDLTPEGRGTDWFPKLSYE